MICPRCKYKNRDGSLSCDLCGALLRRKGDPPAPPPKPTPEQAAQHEALARTELSPVQPRANAEDSAAGELENVLSEEEGPLELIFWLHCFPLEPLELTKDRSYTVGRAKTNDLSLPVGAISRIHARIQWVGQAFAIQDLDSLNGTYVNGRKVETRDLRPGDVIGIGPYDIEVRATRGILEGLKSMMDSGESTQILSRESVFKADSTLSGKIGDVSLAEVFHLVEFNRKTGTLDVAVGERRGRFHFKDGQILHGSFEESLGIDAVAGVLRLASGNFAFQAGEPQCERTLFDPTMKILLDASRRLDEDPDRDDP
jgi:hypothetical protein